MYVVKGKWYFGVLASALHKKKKEKKVLVDFVVGYSIIGDMVSFITHTVHTQKFGRSSFPLIWVLLPNTFMQTIQL